MGLQYRRPSDLPGFMLVWGRVSLEQDCHGARFGWGKFKAGVGVFPDASFI